MPKKSEGGWSGIGTANSGIDPTHVYFLNDHPTQIPPSEILGPVVQNCLNLFVWIDLFVEFVCLLCNVPQDALIQSSFFEIVALEWMKS